METTEGPIGLSRILHLTSTVTDEVVGFLGPATRELSRMGRPQSIVLAGGGAMQIADAAKRAGVRDLRQSALLKVKNGVTSLAEINRVTKD